VTDPILLLPQRVRFFYYIDMHTNMDLVVFSCKMKRSLAMHLGSWIHMSRIIQPQESQLRRQHLYGEACDMYTSHKSLKYIFTRKELNVMQIRWLEVDQGLWSHHPSQKGSCSCNGYSSIWVGKMYISFCCAATAQAESQLTQASDLVELLRQERE
jgi:hypothetical protein